MNCNVEDDLSLIKIGQVITKYKTVIIFITLAFVVVSFFYTRIYNIYIPQYKAELFLLEPSSTDVEVLKRPSIVSKYITSYKKESIFNRLIANLNSIKLWENFYLNATETNDVLLSMHDASSLRKRLNIFQNPDNKEWSISLIGDDKKMTLKILNEYLAFVDRRTAEQLVDNEFMNIDHQILELQNKISIVHKKIQKSFTLTEKDYELFEVQIDLFSQDIDSLKNISFDQGSLHTVNVVQKAYPVKIASPYTGNSTVVISTIFGFLFSLVLVFLLDFIKTNGKK